MDKSNNKTQESQKKCCLIKKEGTLSVEHQNSNGSGHFQVSFGVDNVYTDSYI